MKILTNQLQQGLSLHKEQVHEAVNLLISHTIADSEKAEFLSSLTKKGETAEEITYFVQELLTHSLDPEIEQLGITTPKIDIAGTGGDKLNLFNVSTTAMFVIAACGITVVKHGNRGITSKSGGADVLESLGIKLDAPAKVFRECLTNANLGFLFAPAYHPAFKAIMPVRTALAKKGTRTIFNLIGPLLNPAQPEFQLVGICENSLRLKYAKILKNLGRKSAWVVNGFTQDGQAVDEVSIMGKTDITIVSSDIDQEQNINIKPTDFAINEASVKDLTGGDAKENAKILTNILNGKDQGPKKDMVIMNAAASITCTGIVNSIPEAIVLAEKAIESGQALNKLIALQEMF